MAELKYTPIEEIGQMVEELRVSFGKNLTKPLAYRKQQLNQLYLMIDDNEDTIFAALNRDLGKSKHEAWLGETAFLKSGIVEAIDHLDEWAAPQRPKVSLSYSLNNCHIRKEPIGTVLIIGSWNYPVNILLTPLIGAIAAGCTAICKPSEVATHTASILTELFPKYLDRQAYRIVNGDAQVTTALLEHRLDHVFYTGSGAVGKIIMAAAAKHLTRVTLELGGKSPAIIDKSADVAISAKRIIWSKALNAGQTCIAPDYVICEKSVQEAFLEQVPKVIQQLHGTDVQKSRDYARIIDHRHFDRLVSLLDQTKGRIVVGGDRDRDNLYIAPTVVADVPKNDKLMQEEIFGPILPIVVVENIKEAIEYINSKDQPLSLYPFSKNEKCVEQILENTRSGAVVVNDCLVHFTVPGLPFGGTGQSGIGNYHGKHSYDTFSHDRSTMTTPFYAEKLFDSRYPPYTDRNMSILGWLLLSKPRFKKNRLLRSRFGLFLGALLSIVFGYVVRKRILQ